MWNIAEVKSEIAQMESQLHEMLEFVSKIRAGKKGEESSTES